MTLTEAPPRPRTLPSLHAGRLVRLEVRRNAMLLLLPLLAALFWFDTYRTVMQSPPYWALRGIVMQKHITFDFVPFVAGVAAWAGSRDGRRGTLDLVTTTARPRSIAQITGWAATTAWAVLGYLACVAVVYGVTAAQHAPGHPVWWPVVVGVCCLAAVTAASFATGAFFPGRFSTPLAAVVALLVFELGFRGSSPYLQIVPINAVPDGIPATDIAIFYRYLPDLSIAQVMLLVGLCVGALAALGLPNGSGTPAARRVCAVLVVVGLALAGTAVGLAGTGRQEVTGMMNIPALHNASDDRPIGYSPVCAGTSEPVCVHPAFQQYLPAAQAAFEPLLRELAGLPGAPTSIVQEASRYAGWPPVHFSGQPTVVSVPLGRAVPNQSSRQYTTAELAEMIKRAFDPPIIAELVSTRRPPLNDAQAAVLGGLLIAVGAPQGPCAGACVITQVGAPRPGSAAYDAATRFAALPASTRHDWLMSNLAALRAGRITLEQLP